MFKDQYIFESEPFTKYFCSNRAHLPITDQGHTEWICLLLAPSHPAQPQTTTAGVSALTPSTLSNSGTSDDQPSYCGGNSPEVESEDPCLSWDCHILALPLKSWKDHFSSGPLSNLWDDQRTVLLLLLRPVVSSSLRPRRRQPTRLPRPWDSPRKNTGGGCHFLLQCMKVNSESEVAHLCQRTVIGSKCGSDGKASAYNAGDLGSIPELGRSPGSIPGSSVHGIFQARILEWVTISFPRRVGHD